MGIPAYFSQIIRKYPEIIQSSIDNRIDNLLMDCNSIIYDCLHSLDVFDNIEEDVIQKVIQKISEYIKFIKPKKCVYISFDGVAPLAKMDQQKKRRQRSTYESTHPLLNKEKKHDWSTNNITPGMPFMEKLSESMYLAFIGKEGEYGVKNIIVSASDKVGEGEHKLFGYLRSNSSILEYSVVYGLDADLIMLSMFALSMKLQNNVYIFRETPSFATDIIKKHDSMYLYVDISLFKMKLEAELLTSSSNCSLDYSFMCMLLGNDNIPNICCLNLRTNGMDILMKAYVYSGNLLDTNMNIISSNFKKFMSYICKAERNLLIEEYKKRDHIQKRLESNYEITNYENNWNNLPVLCRTAEKYISPSHDGWERRYYRSLFGDNADIKKICQNYLEMLSWCKDYYTTSNVDFRQKYDYLYAPLAIDLYNYISNHTINTKISNDTKPYSSKEQLDYVLKPLDKVNIKVFKKYIWE